MTKLSICIPTYNRANYLSLLIDSIINQANGNNRDDIQICVSDNCSNDNTKSLIEHFAKEGKVEIVLNINEKNIGPDLNYLKSIEIASGEYCWLMGSDDIIKEGALNLILTEIEKQSEIAIFLANRIDCDKDMIFFHNKKWLKNDIKDIVIDFNFNKDIIYYLNQCDSIGGVFSYLSSIIVKRDDWKKIEYDDSFTGTAFSHVFMLLSILTNGKKMKYIEEPIVYCRGGNDSFQENAKQRFLIDINGYFKIFSHFFQNDVEKCALRILTREHKPLELYLLCVEHKFSISELNLLKKIGFSKFVISNIRLLCMYQKIYKKIFYTMKKFY